MQLQNLFNLYTKYGDYDYIGEDVSQIEHMIQAAMLAEENNEEKDIVISCFLHDIGHLIGIDKKLNGDDFGTFTHELIGKDYLYEIGFKYPIPELVYNHVYAKRYLVSKYPEYYKKLSDASKVTLKQQGGALDEKEMKFFEQDELFEISLRIRTYDEMAKNKDKIMKPVEFYFELIEKYFQ
tara:strand:- start:2161 stop:2703 length:543 start_codon:yes stop_codon:yes gene_type:complete